MEVFNYMLLIFDFLIFFYYYFRKYCNEYDMEDMGHINREFHYTLYLIREFRIKNIRFRDISEIFNLISLIKYKSYSFNY